MRRSASARTHQRFRTSLLLTCWIAGSAGWSTPNFQLLRAGAHFSPGTGRASGAWNTCHVSLLQATGRTESGDREDTEVPSNYFDQNQISRRALVGWFPLASSVGISPLLSFSASAASYPQQKTEEEWSAILSDQQRFVLREGGCQESVFASSAKFEARSGWPSFGDALPGKVEVAKMNPFMETLSGAEIRCATCGGRLGERFQDGASFPGTPAMRTGKRYSTNGAALVFAPADGGPVASGEAAGSFVKRRKYDWKMRDGGLRSI